MDEQRLDEIEATANSPAYRDEADMIGVDELIAEIRRLWGLEQPKTIHPHLAHIPDGWGRERLLQAAIAIRDQGPISAIALRRYLGCRHISDQIRELLSLGVIERLPVLEGAQWPRYQLRAPDATP